MSQIFSTRYYASQHKRSDEVIVKVCGGYVLMSARDRQIWRNQK